MAAVVLDANILVRLVLPSQRDPNADALWLQCSNPQVEVHLPFQVVSEAMSAIRRMVHHDLLTLDEGRRKVLELQAIADRCSLHGTQWAAWEVASQFNLPRTYDSEVYALAQSHGAELWTADDRFVNAMQGQRPPWVHRLSDFSLPTP